MRRVILDGSVAAWRAHARAFALEGVPPGDIEWVDLVRSERGGGELFAAPDPTPLPPAPTVELRLPRQFGQRAATVGCHRSPDVWRVLYTLLFRIARGERGLLDDPLEPDVVAFMAMEKAIRRDAHKMHAFVRFRRIDDASARNGERFIAWYEPSHLIVEREASFFQDRFPSMDWSILTPDRCAHWDGEQVVFTEGAPRSAAPSHDELEEMWCSYYASIFNPARVKLKAMTAEMPRKFWSTLPETKQIPDLLADVPRRLEEMARTSRRMADSALPYVPPGGDLGELREALGGCEGCELHRDHTRPVLGEGPADARIALLGEQPGDMEERAGRPFVGPAGEVLDAAIREAGLDRSDLYLTNAVKHFRHGLAPATSDGTPRGKRRIHKRPTAQHSSRCQPWLDAEMEAIRPLAFVCLGATAMRTVFGPTARLPSPDDPPVAEGSRYADATFRTFHPAAILRATDDGKRRAMRSHLVRVLMALQAAAERIGAEVQSGSRDDPLPPG